MAFLPKSKALPLTFARANEVLTYCPATGHLRWHISRAKCAEGQRAGTLCKGYLRIQIDYVFYGAHRLAWLLSHGQWPTMGLDHINGIRDDNRLANLREATPQENARNRCLGRPNKSGKTGVHPLKGRGLWGAEIGLDGRNIKLGRFQCLSDAIAARCAAEKHYFGDFARQVSEARHDR